MKIDDAPDPTKSASDVKEPNTHSHSEHMWRGFYVSTIFCSANVIIFPLSLLLVLYFVSGDPSASKLGDEDRLTEQWKLTQMAFITALLLDFVSWLFTVDYDRARLYYFVLVIQGLPVVSYGLLAAGAAPILVDVHGRRFIVVRYVVWLFTTPAMLYFYSCVCSISRRELVTAMILEYIVILAGIPACLLPFPYYGPFLLISCVACYYVVMALSKMLTLAIEESSRDDASYRSLHRIRLPYLPPAPAFRCAKPCGARARPRAAVPPPRRSALQGARLFMTTTFAAIPGVWFLAYFNLVPAHRSAQRPHHERAAARAPSRAAQHCSRTGGSRRPASSGPPPIVDPESRIRFFSNTDGSVIQTGE